MTAHDEDCLCDVIVTERTPINFGLTDLWHGDTVARVLNLGVPWTAADVATFGESLTKAYDIWARQTQRGETFDVEVLRGKVMDLLRSGESMVDMATLLDMPFKTIIHAMTNGVPATVWGWDDHVWLLAEAVIYDHFEDHGAETLIEMLGGDMHRCVVEQLAEWYGVQINLNGQTRLDACRQALLDGFHPIDAAARLTADGYEVNAQQMRMMRNRMAKKKEVPAELPARVAHALI